MSTTPGLWEICLRLACAMLVGLVIGTEREYTHRPAGMRTHILVALGACVVSITGEIIFHHYSLLGSTADPARLSAQVITGVGFLGAGTIMREGATVKGLTTAASLWAVACLGIAAGFGYYALAVFGMVFILITLTLFEWLQKVLMNPANKRSATYILETTDISATLSTINEKASAERIAIRNMMAEAIEGGYKVSFNAEFGSGKLKNRRVRFFNAIIAAPETKSLHNADEEVQSVL
ncbi:MAG: MgtC/SapB family protein [Oscillospiraceae bacterium]|nr:MgtC/SapB family protein [Oscillospiraceae bacterium]MBQ8769529.1 MgtC/SapB family protein [Oscillospiraceae bacterium]